MARETKFKADFIYSFVLHASGWIFGEREKTHPDQRGALGNKTTDRRTAAAKGADSRAGWPQIFWLYKWLLLSALRGLMRGRRGRVLWHFKKQLQKDPSKDTWWVLADITQKGILLCKPPPLKWTLLLFDRASAGLLLFRLLNVTFCSSLTSPPSHSSLCLVKFMCCIKAVQLLRWHTMQKP